MGRNNIATVLGCTLFLSVVNANAQAQDNLPDGLYAKILTDRGEIVLQLEFEKTPLTVTNFVGLAEGKLKTSVRNGKPFFDGLSFHRVIDNFMIQGGDPNGNGSGGPGYTFPDEFSPDLKHTGPGILSMANRGPNTNGSQFFITHTATPWLDGKHTVFGHVVEGQDVVNSIKQGDKIKKVTIVRVGEKAKAFRADQASFDALRENIAAENRQKAEKAQEATLAEIRKKWPNLKTTSSGLMYEITKEGTGEKPKKGSTVSVHYTGYFLDGQVFDSSIQRGQPIEFPVGTGRVIRGWDEGILDMKKGEKRLLVIPPELAYGEAGYPGAIPPNAFLVFETELVNIR